MKKFIYPIAIVLLLMSVSCFAIENDRYKYIQFNSTTTVSTQAALLHSITITGTAAVAFTVYDSTASTVTSPVIASFSASTAAGTYIFDTQAQNGLQINEAASGPQITVNYR